MACYPPFSKIDADFFRADFDGEKFNLYDFRFHIDPFQGLKAMNTLRCYPFEFHEDKVALAEKLKKRGEKFYKLQTQSGSEQMFHHKDDLIYIPDFANMPYEVAGFYILGEIMAEATSPKKKDEWKDSVSWISMVFDVN